MNRNKVLEFFEGNKDFFDGTVNANIEKYRKGDMSICIIDENGNKISNAKIKIEEKEIEALTENIIKEYKVEFKRKTGRLSRDFVGIECGFHELCRDSVRES